MSTTTQLHSGLLELHGALLALVRAEYERVHGVIQGSGAMLQLVLGDEAFAWLRPLSKLLVDLDDPDVVRDAAAARAAVERLLGAGSAFGDRYRTMLDAHPDLAAEHAHVMRVVRNLPASS